MKYINFMPGELILKKLIDIKERRGIHSLTETIRYCITETHSSLFKDYIEVQKMRAAITPVDKALAKVEAEELREQMKAKKEQNHLESICLLMDNAELTQHPITGKPACKYPVYTANGPHEVDTTWMTEELSVLNDETPSLQYHDVMGNTGVVGKENIMKVLAKK